MSRKFNSLCYGFYLGTQMVILLPMLLHHNRFPALYLAAATVLQWSWLLNRFCPRLRRQLKTLSRLSFATILGCAPFVCYQLTYLHGCVIRGFEGSPWLLVIFFIGAPTYLRWNFSKSETNQAP